jgi:hypothetical protein
VKATDLAAVIGAIGGVGGVVVAAIAIIVSARSTKNSVEAQERTTEAALSAQHDIAAGERLWQRRADVYIEVLAWVELIRRQGTLTQMDPSAAVEMSDSLMSGARLFASEAVLNQFEEISTAYIQYMTLLEHGENDGPMTFAASQTLQSAISQLMDLVRAEILEHRQPSQ